MKGARRVYVMILQLWLLLSILGCIEPQAYAASVLSELHPDIAPSAPDQEVQETSVDLNALIADKFSEYIAWLTRYSDLNGTTVDPNDYSDNKYVTQSTPMILTCLAYMYEQTNDPFYLALLRTWLDGIISNADNYRMIPDVGEIFYAITFRSGSFESPDTPVMPTAFAGSAATMLYAWTGEAKYKDLADRVAHESLQHLTAVANTTDLAWSASYFQNRVEASAKIGVNRQTALAVFFTLYAKYINSTYDQYVEPTINWVWRAQVADGGLAYDIGVQSISYPYTAYALFEALEAYRLEPTNFGSALKNRMANSVSALIKDRGTPSSYLTCLFTAGALGKALQTDYFAPYSNMSHVKALVYSSLRSWHLTARGFKLELSSSTYGFRWQQHGVGTFIQGVYPLSDAIFDGMEDWTTYAVRTASGNYQWRGFNGEMFDCDTDAFRDGENAYGMGFKGSNFYLSWTETKSVFGPASIRASENRSYYQRFSSYWSSRNLNITSYLYPTSGVLVGDITGTVVSQMRVTDDSTWRVVAENGTSWQLNTFTSGEYYKLSQSVLLYSNHTRSNGRLSLFIKAQNDTWGYFASTLLYLNVTRASHHRILFSYLTCWANGTKDPAGVEMGCVHNESQAFSALKSIADDFDTIQPVSSDLASDAYHGKIRESLPDASWKTTYRESQNSEVKLIGHSKPQEIHMTAWSYSANKVTLALSASFTAASAIRIFVADGAEPTQVRASQDTLTWSYNSSTKILIINIVQTGSENVLIDWRRPGDVNGDGTVSDSDLIGLREAYGSSSSESSWNMDCDLNWDGIIDLFDLYRVGRNYRMTGDVNGDGKVDYLDLIRLSLAYGSDPSTPNWDSNCDFNRDYVVAAYDLLSLGKNYGKTGFP